MRQWSGVEGERIVVMEFWVLFVVITLKRKCVVKKFNQMGNFV